RQRNAQAPRARFLDQDDQQVVAACALHGTDRQAQMQVAAGDLERPCSIAGTYRIAFRPQRDPGQARTAEAELARMAEQRFLLALLVRGIDAPRESGIRRLLLELAMHEVIEPHAADARARDRELA